jgi:uncharacterized protein YoxC
MGPGGIATIIASVSLLVIALAISYTVIRVSRLIDEVKKTVHSVNRITSTAEAMTGKVAGAINGILDKESTVMKLLGTVANFAGRRSSNKDYD